METITFDSRGVRCEAWWLPAAVGDLTSDAGAPCVVMAHGFGTTRDSGLLPFAERFAAAGCHVLVFDYRGFGGSEGLLRQDVDHRRHREDYHAAVAAARARPDVDPTRVALWGTSYSGGHVVVVAAQDPTIAAVVSQGAAMDGLAALTGRGKKIDPTATAATPPSSGGSRSQHYDQVRDTILTALGERALEIQHVGSTSVPGLWAKPVIDVDLMVADSADEAAWLPALEASGFELKVREPEWEEHRCLRGATPTSNLHVFSSGAREPRRHRMFRDWLRTHPEDREAYGAVKREVASRGFSDSMLYNNEKAWVVYDLYEQIFAADAAHPHDPRPRSDR